ncbi:serine hydrolase [Lapidilactobacillus wuchangensis]|uniref:serine hydrolase n=1 Tax=Lapidilactobacillus wuchangensis TaxID=2486001 RepID=UPI000F780B50|nr:serine hydrolase [Lapidilactobacillus wuchangensis]
MTCPNCGAKNDQDAAFCWQCGQSLAATPADIPATAATSETPTEQTVATNICPNCGTPNEPGENFCLNCGTPLTDAPVKAASSNSVAAPEPVVNTAAAANQVTQSLVSNNQPTAPANTPTPSAQLDNQPMPAASTGKVPPAAAVKPKPNKKGLWAAILLLVLLLGGAGYYFYQNNQPSAKSVATADRSSKKRSSKKSRVSSSKSAKSSQKVTKAAPKKAAQSNEPPAITSLVEPILDRDLSGLAGNTSAYVSRTDSDEEVVRNNREQRAASDIKIFIMITAYEQAKNNQLDLDGKYELSDDDKVGGTGVVQSMPAGTRLTLRECIQYMIDESDNTAANIMIDAVGGLDAVNDEISQLGLTDTQLERKLMDTDALNAGRDNMTSAKDLGVVLKQMYNHQLVSSGYDTEMLNILAKNKNHSKLLADLPAGAKGYNKTGEFSTYGVQNDAAILESSKAALVVVVLSEDGQESTQIQAMNLLGADLYQKLLI